MKLRERMVEATGRVIRERGLAGTTTKEIAHAAGCAEGSIYNHFGGRHELLAAAAEGCLPNSGLVRQFPGRAGFGTVRGNLEEFANTALSIFSETVPLWAAVLSDPEVLAAHRRSTGGGRSGLEGAFEAVADYVAAEQKLGRVGRRADPSAAAEILVGACHSRAFLRSFETDPEASHDRFVDGLVGTLLVGLAPEAEE